MVIPPAGSEHIIFAQQLYSFGCGGGAVQHQADGKGGSDHRLAGLLVGGVTVQRENGDRNAFFIHAVQADERRGEGCQLFGHARVRRVGVDVIQCGKGDRGVTVLGGAVDQHGGGIVLEIIVAAHQGMAVRALGAERAAAKVWGFHMDGQVGQGFGQDGIDHALVIGNAAVDQAVEIIRIVNIHAVEVIVFVIGQFADAVDAFEPGKVHPAANGGGDDDHGNQSGNDPLNRFHLFLLFMTGWRTNGGGAG